MLPAYAELHCLSNFSFLRGASSPEELAERAQGLGYSALAITDECSVAGAVRAHFAAKEAGLSLVIGSEFTLVDGVKLVLLATDRASYGNLAQHLAYASGELCPLWIVGLSRRRTRLGMDGESDRCKRNE